MDEERRRNGPKKGGGSRNERSLMLERRPLKTIPLSPPEYKVAHQVLLDSYIEKDVRFAGVVPNVPIDLDATNRTEILRLIDRGKREAKIAWVVSYEHDAILSLSAQNMKLFQRDGKEELLLRLPIHEIAAICYIRDDEQHILSIKFGSFEFAQGTTDDNSDLCQLAILYCGGTTAAEELCALIGQCFQLVYTEATMQFLDTKLSEAAAGISIGTSTIQSGMSDASVVSTPNRDLDDKNLAFLSHSSLNLKENFQTATFSTETLRSLPAMQRRNSITQSDSELSSTANELIQDYMKKLHTKLTTEELRRFAQLLRAMHSSQPFPEFCQKVLELYGPDRKHLLLGMRPFIPERNYTYFETFLERVGLTSPSIVSATGGGAWSDSPPLGYPSRNNYRRSTGGLHTPGDDYERMLNDNSTDIDNLTSAIELTGNSSLPPKTT